MKYVRGKKVIVVIAIFTLVILLGSYVGVLAVTSSELKNQREQNEQDIESTKEQQEKIQSQLSSVKEEVEELTNQIFDYETEIDDLTEKINAATSEIDSLQLELEKTQKDLEEKEDLLERRLVASYKAGNTTYLDVLLSSESLTSFLSNYYLIEELAESDTKLINTIKETKDSIEVSKKELETARDELETSKETLETKKSALAVLQREKNAKVNELSAEDQALQNKIEEMQAEDSRIRAAIKAAEASEAAAAAAAKAAEEAKKNSGSSSGGSSGVVSGSSGYIYPLPSAYCTITTGLYYSSGAYHGAVDFGSGGIYGQPVYAVKAGTVVISTDLTNSYGTYVMINHHDGTYTLYGHGILGSRTVSAGQTVTQGQQIMRVGSTGNSTGPHLHFEVRVSPGLYNNKVDPRGYLP